MTLKAAFRTTARSGPRRPPAVLQILPSLVSGGVERGTVDIATALVRAGWRAVVASAGGPMVHELERVGAEHVTLPLESKNPFTIRRNVRPIASLIERCPIDIVHARSRAPAWSALWAAERTGCRFVTTFHAPYGAATAAKRRYNSVMAKGERVIAISEFVAEYVAETYTLPPERLRTIPRGIDIARFDPAAVWPSRLVTLAADWRLEDGVPVILLPARLTRWKGHLDLLDAVAALGRRDVQVVFVGSDDQRPAFREEVIRRISRDGLEDIVHIVGECRDMPAAYMLADVVVSSSNLPEGFGRIAVEAQAMGRPLVATDHGGSRETVIHGETGWLVPPRDPEALAALLDGVLQLSEAERLDLGERSRAWVASRFTTERMCASTLQLYEELLFPEMAAA